MAPCDRVFSAIDDPIDSSSASSPRNDHVREVRSTWICNLRLARIANANANARSNGHTENIWKKESVFVSRTVLEHLHLGTFRTCGCGAVGARAAGPGTNENKLSPPLEPRRVPNCATLCPHSNTLCPTPLLSAQTRTLRAQLYNCSRTSRRHFRDNQTRTSNFFNSSLDAWPKEDVFRPLRASPISGSVFGQF